MLEKTLENPLDYKEIKLVNPKGNQSWIFIGRTDAEAEAPVLWPPYVKSQLIGKDPDAGKEWRQEKGTTEDEMVERHHRLNGYDFEQTLGDSEGQGSLSYYSSWGNKESDRTQWLNKNSSVWRHPFPCLSVLQHGKLLKNWVKSFYWNLNVYSHYCQHYMLNK